ncbi:Hypothetical protein PBC10988_28180 [Planctomycetales bacterium 10988]|nr:Hypothetical protein PBC10988_28180 [Planctomycetales bacterium 10988]
MDGPLEVLETSSRTPQTFEESPRTPLETASPDLAGSRKSVQGLMSGLDQTTESTPSSQAQSSHDPSVTYALWTARLMFVSTLAGGGLLYWVGVAWVDWLLAMLPLTLLTATSWLLCYLWSQPNRRQETLRREREQLSAECQEYEKRFEGQNRHRERLVREFRQQKEGLVSQRDSILQEGKKQANELQLARQKAHRQIDRRMETLKQKIDGLQKEVSARLDRANQECEQQIEALIRQAQWLESPEALQKQQTQFVQEQLQAASLVDANLTGIGATFKVRLQEAGFNTAWDMDAERLSEVKRLGKARIETLLAWRKEIATEAESAAPSGLTAVELEQLRQETEEKRQAIEEARAEKQKALFDQERKWKNRWKEVRREAERVHEEIETRADTELQEVRDRCLSDFQELCDAALEPTKQLQATGRTATEEAVSTHTLWQTSLERIEWLKAEEAQCEPVRFAEFCQRIFFWQTTHRQALKAIAWPKTDPLLTPQATIEAYDEEDTQPIEISDDDLDDEVDPPAFPPSYAELPRLSQGDPRQRAA